MNHIIQLFLVKLSNWKFVLFAVLSTLVFTGIIFPYYQAKINAIGGKEAPILDLRTSYSLADVQTFFTEIGVEGRSIHQFVTGKIDMVFPFFMGWR